jgi:NDT80 / PhoG like DNA-binding  family
MCPTSTHQLFNSAHNPQSITIRAQLSGMFFLAESPWQSDAMSNLEPPTLTCYRRNLFNISGTIHIPRDVATVIGPNGHEAKVGCLSVVISTTESLAGTSITLVSAPPKHATRSSSMTNISPGPIKLDVEGNSNQYADPCPFSVFWNRLQFRTATAKNNRRAALQQYYFITINVVATLGDGSKVVVCKATSLPIIVRGRSPGSYQTTKTGVPELESTITEKIEVLEPTYATIGQSSGMENLATLLSHPEELCTQGSERDVEAREVSRLPTSLLKTLSMY